MAEEPEPEPEPSADERTLHGARERKMLLPFHEFCLSPGEHKEEEMVSMCNLFLQTAPQHCRRLKIGKKGQCNHNCTCLGVLQGEEEVAVKMRPSVARCMVLHFKLGRTHQTRTLMEWMKHTSKDTGIN